MSYDELAEQAAVYGQRIMALEREKAALFRELTTIAQGGLACWAISDPEDYRRWAINQAELAIRNDLANKCNCSMRTKLVGDGCQYCNPKKE
jgi:hypothetical protein